MAPKSAAALFLLAAMIAGLAPTLQAQLNARTVGCFVSLVKDNRMERCVRMLVAFKGAIIHPDCCKELLRRAGTSGEAKRCACEFGNVVAALRVDVDQMCQQAASNGDVADGPSSKLSELCG